MDPVNYIIEAFGESCVLLKLFYQIFPSQNYLDFSHVVLEAAVWRFSIKYVFLKISQNSQENTSARVSF